MVRLTNYRGIILYCLFIETYNVGLKFSLNWDLLQSTYDYGRQFLQASLVLRRTCRYELSPNYEMEEKLNSAWGDFSSAMAERGARLSVALMFHRSAEKVGAINVHFLLTT